MNGRRPLPARLPCVVLACLLGILLLPAGARAQASPRDPVGAEDLFRRAMEQLKEGDWEGACDRFQMSMDLDPSVSTLAKIAQCREHEGKLATAWYEYQRALKLARGMDLADWRRRELEQFIGARVAAVEPRVPKLRITVEPAPPDLEIVRDGTLVAVSALGEPLPVDPGEHEIIARAPGFLEQKVAVVVEEASVAEVKVVLEAAPHPALSPKPAPRPAAEPGPRPALPPPAAPEKSSGGAPGLSWSAGGWVLGGAGLAGLGAAGYFALYTLSLVDDSNSHCGTTNRCDQAGLELRRDAADAQTTALVLAGVGAAALGIGIVLVTAAPDTARPERRATAARFETRVGLTTLSARGTW